MEREEYKEYWEKRSNTYKSLDDVSSKRTAYKIVNLAKSLGLPFAPSILDVGCGPGIITRVLRENFRHSTVWGIDFSEKMIQKAQQNCLPDLKFTCEDFLSSSFIPDQKFDFILMSLVLHHLLDGKDFVALLKANSLLAKNGSIIVAEAVPPEDEIFEEYRNVFLLKERRNCYLVNHLVAMLRSAEFVRVRSTTYRFWIRMFKWLNDDTLSKEKKRLIWSLHLNGSARWKLAYQMTSVKSNVRGFEFDDYELKCKMALITGRKIVEK